MSSSTFHITVIGIGAMGGGMARALMKDSCSCTVTAYDRDTLLVQTFFEESIAAQKSMLDSPPTTLRQAVTSTTDVCLVVLMNEEQCQKVCFGGCGIEGDTTESGEDNDNNLLSCMPTDSYVVISSTVRPQWMTQASHTFSSKGIHLIDCPVSGGPVRARAGDLTLMVASEDANHIAKMQPILEAMGRPGDIYHIVGGAGAGSMAKMVHQLLAGVHIVAAAEALALAAAAGLDVEQIYQLVNGAAGASWMFRDRGERMISSKGGNEVKSMLDIFVKDLDIVYSEAKRFHSPIPLASTALQQFVSGQSYGLGRNDDSQVVQVYERVNGKKVHTDAPQQKHGTNVGDMWVFEDGSCEEIYEVGQEPRHHVVLHNDYVRALRVSFPPNDTTLAHRHAEDSIYFFLEDLSVINHVQGCAPACDCMELGEVRYGKHKTETPLVHKIINKTDKPMLCIDAEILRKPPVTSSIPLLADKHDCIKTREKCRVYRLTLEPGESVEVSYPFFHFTVVLQPGTIRTEILRGRLQWTETLQRGDVFWKEPVINLRKTNTCTKTYVEYIAEWC